MNAHQIRYWARWQVGANGAGLRHWFVSRHIYDGKGAENACDRRGRVRWFATREAAQKLADALNNTPDLIAAVRLGRALASLETKGSANDD